MGLSTGSRLVAWAFLLASAPAWAQGQDTAAATEEPSATPTSEEPRAAPPIEGPSTASAEPPPAPSGPHTANSFQLGLGFRYGALLSDGDLNPWGTGLGLDLGYTLPQAIYLGGSFEYFFGDSVNLGAQKLKSNIWQLSAEGGYDVGLGESFVIRPKVGVGIASARSSFEGCPAGLSCDSTSKTKPLVAPGATFMLFTQHLSLAVDVRYALVLSDPTTTGLIFSVGFGF
jgi:hypothetical protein